VLQESQTQVEATCLLFERSGVLSTIFVGIWNESACNETCDICNESGYESVWNVYETCGVWNESEYESVSTCFGFVLNESESDV